MTATDCANMTLAIGASPIMADNVEEVCDIVSVSSALVINIGTLNQRTINAMILAGKEANKFDVPVIFDPVGAGASKLRNQTTMNLLEEVKVNVIRGNLSEMRFIAGLSSHTRGVDSQDAEINLNEVKRTAEIIARNFCNIAAITGDTDVITDGTKTFCVENGHEMMGSLTGTGCMCSAVVGAFCGTSSDSLKAILSGILTMGISGEIAFEKSGHMGMGSYHTSLIDEMSKLKYITILERVKLYEI